MFSRETVAIIQVLEALQLLVEKRTELQLRLLKGKIHRATVTGADLNYEGSIEIDLSLMEAAGIIPFEQVDIWNITNGERFSTYALPARKSSGTIAVNGAAARKVQPSDEIIITAFAWMSEKQALHWKPHVVLVDKENRLKPKGNIVQTIAHSELLHDA